MNTDLGANMAAVLDIRGFLKVATYVEHDPTTPTSGHRWRYSCHACPATTLVANRWSSTGRKRNGWLVMFGIDDPVDESIDRSIVLTFCPACAVQVVGTLSNGAPSLR